MFKFDLQLFAGGFNAVNGIRRRTTFVMMISLPRLSTTSFNAVNGIRRRTTSGETVLVAQVIGGFQCRKRH